MVTGEEYLPIGGYSGENPAPSLAALEHLVASGRVSLVFIPVRLVPRDPRLLWVRSTALVAGSSRPEAREPVSTTANRAACRASRPAGRPVRHYGLVRTCRPSR